MYNPPAVFTYVLRMCKFDERREEFLRIPIVCIECILYLGYI